MMHEYPAEHKVLNYIKQLLSKQQRKYLLSGAHYLILDQGAFYERCRQQLLHDQANDSNKPPFVIHGMSHGDILIASSCNNEESATLLCVKPHLPPQPHFIKSWVFALFEKIFGISFGPKGFCRYTKERPFVINPHPNCSKNPKNIILSSQPTFLPAYHTSERKLNNHKNTDHFNFNQSPQTRTNFPKFK